MYLIKNACNKECINNKLSILGNKLNIICNKLSIMCKQLGILSDKLNIIVHTILVQAILVQRYSCAPNILYYIKYNTDLVIEHCFLVIRHCCLAIKLCFLAMKHCFLIIKSVLKPSQCTQTKKL
jgi:hypothetical protein